MSKRMTTQEAEKRARELVEQMTIEERASQLRYDAPAIERLNIPAYNWWNEASTWGSESWYCYHVSPGNRSSCHV